MLELTVEEEAAILSDLMGIECLINYHDCKSVESEAFGIKISYHDRRVAELLKRGREIILAEPDLWSGAQLAVFILRYSEMNHTVYHDKL